MSAARAIGGYFGWEPHVGQAMPWWTQGVAVQSGRMALRLALPQPLATLWLPAYFCPPVTDCLAASGWSIRRYALAEDFGPDATVRPEASDRVLLVDYFGMSSRAVDRAVERFGADNTIVDASMAWFSPPRKGVPTAYSPRKFAGLPDGGLLVTTKPVASLSPANETATQRRTVHLLKRASGEVSAGRVDFATAEASLDDDSAPQAMSQLTRLCMDAIDWPEVAVRRRRNAVQLSSGLAAMGFHGLTLEPNDIPLCWPVFGLDAAAWRRRLAEHGIYCPAYWPALPLPEHDVVGHQLRDATLFLPIDQRYGEDDMSHILQTIDALRSES